MVRKQGRTTQRRYQNNVLANSTALHALMPDMTVVCFVVNSKKVQLVWYSLQEMLCGRPTYSVHGMPSKCIAHSALPFCSWCMPSMGEHLQNIAAKDLGLSHTSVQLSPLREHQVMDTFSLQEALL